MIYLIALHGTEWRRIIFFPDRESLEIWLMDTFIIPENWHVLGEWEPEHFPGVAYESGEVYHFN